MWVHQLHVPLIQLPANYGLPKLIVYHNGRRILTDLPKIPSDQFILIPRNFTSDFYIINSTAVVTLRIPQTETTDMGTYEVIFITSIYQGDFGCCPEYFSLLTDEDGIALKYFVIGLAVLELKLASE